MPKPAREVMSSLRQKGFGERENDHTFFHLIVEGRKTPIFTKVSHGEKEIGDRLLGVMARQLRLSKKQFIEFIDCSLTESDLVTHLREGGHIATGST